MRRGFLRLWIVASLIWIGACGWLFFERLTGQCPSKGPDITEFYACQVLFADIGTKYFIWWDGAYEKLALTVLPPIGALILGIAGFWIARGFEKPN